MPKIKNYSTVLSSKNSAIISVAETLLKDAGINYFLNNENSSTEIQVEGDENFINARKILMDLEELDFHEDN
jgi:hypothetical protein